MSSEETVDFTKEENVHKGYRILALEGDSGCVFCRVHGEMQRTLPSLSANGSIEFATRTLLRMANITVARQLGRDRSMVGPLDYLANLEQPERFLYTILLPTSDWPLATRFPRYIAHPREGATVADRSASAAAAATPHRPVTNADCVIADALWISGKRHPNAVKRAAAVYKAEHGIDRVFGHSVFEGPGILELSLVEDEATKGRAKGIASTATACDVPENANNESGTTNEASKTPGAEGGSQEEEEAMKSAETVFNFPLVDATAIDLGPFKCRVVPNHIPFPFLAPPNTSDADGAAAEPAAPLPPTHWPRPVTYQFQPMYAHEAVYGSGQAGLFLETHDFTQSMTPVNPDSRGFIVVGRWLEDDAYTTDPSTAPPPAKGRTVMASSCSADNDDAEEPTPTSRRLALLALRIPYGYTIIIDKDCIHGDTTFIGLYAMAMTTDHVVMGTADTVFVKHSTTKRNIDFSCAEHSIVADGVVVTGNNASSRPADKVGEGADAENVDSPTALNAAASSSAAVPLPVPVREGLVVYKDATKAELDAFKAATKGASFVMQPFSKLSWTTTMYRRLGWAPSIATAGDQPPATATATL